MVAEVEQFGSGPLETRSVDAGRRPDAVEVTRLILGRDEAPVQPDSGATRVGEQRQAFGQTVEQLTAPEVPSEACCDLIPPGFILTGRKQTVLRVERRDGHAHNILVV